MAISCYIFYQQHSLILGLLYFKKGKSHHNKSYVLKSVNVYQAKLCIDKSKKNIANYECDWGFNVLGSIWR